MRVELLHAAVAQQPHQHLQEGVWRDDGCTSNHAPDSSCKSGRGGRRGLQSVRTELQRTVLLLLLLSPPLLLLVVLVLLLLLLQLQPLLLLLLLLLSQMNLQLTSRDSFFCLVRLQVVQQVPKAPRAAEVRHRIVEAVPRKAQPEQRDLFWAVGSGAVPIMVVAGWCVQRERVVQRVVLRVIAVDGWVID
jgi:hypothetical protein